MVIQIPKELHKKGIRFVLLEKGGKKPFQKEWQNKEIGYDSGELIAHIGKNGNYGVMGGGSLKLIMIDFDDDKVQDLIVPKLPKTFTVKTGSGKLHKYFFSDRNESFKIFDEKMETLADVQGEGKQVVGAGSIHPNGNKYTVVDDSPIVFLPYAEIKALLMAYDKKPKEEKKEEKIKAEVHDDFLDYLQNKVSMKEVLSSFGVDISRNPTACLFHSSEGGHCMGFNNVVAHCFHCDRKWNIFSFVKEAKKCSYKEALDYLANISGLSNELEKSRRRYIDQLKENQKDEKRDLQNKFLELIHDKKISSATELITEYIKENYNLFTSKNDEKSEIWIYEEGIYVQKGKSAIKEIMREILEKWFNTYYYNQIISKIEPDTFTNIDDFLNSQSISEVPVKNGILNIFTRELRPFTPEKVFFNKLPVEYNPKAECPQVEKFLSEILTDEKDKNVFYEMGGFCLLKEYKFEKAFMLVGYGRNGKDKSLELIKRVIGIENCCSVPLASLNPDSFIMSHFFGKMANLSGDIGHSDLKDTSVFKSLTGRSLQTAPRKFLTPITFVNYAKFIFACNELPMVYDASRGFWDRWILLEYPYTFVTKEELNTAVENSKLKLRDEDIIEKISTPSELSGLLNKFLDGLDRLLQNKTFSQTRGSEEIKNLWIQKANSFMAFCNDKIECDYTKTISKKSLRREYTKYCQKHKLSGKSDIVIKRTLEELFGVSEKNERAEFSEIWEMCWEGITWKPAPNKV